MTLIITILILSNQQQMEDEISCQLYCSAFFGWRLETLLSPHWITPENTRNGPSCQGMRSILHMVRGSGTIKRAESVALRPERGVLDWKRSGEECHVVGG